MADEKEEIEITDEAADPNVDPPMPLESPEPQAPALHEELGLGEDFKDLPPDETARRLHNDLRYERKLREQYEQQANMAGHHFRSSPDYQQYQKWQAEQSKPKNEEEPKFWAPPDFNKTLVEQWTEVDPESKAVKFKAGTPPHVLDMVAKYHDYLTDFHDNKWRHNPYETIKPYLHHEAKKLFTEMFEQRLGERDERHIVDEFERANAKWLYEWSDGAPVVDPMSGKFMFSAGGQAFMRYVSEAGQMGIQSQSRKASYALRMLERDRALAQHRTAAVSQEAETTDEQKKLDFQKSAAKRTAGRGGSFPKAESKSPNSQNKKQNIAEKLRAALTADGTGDDARWT